MKDRLVDGKRLETLIAQADLTLRGFAEAAEISYSYAKYIVAGDRQPSAQVAHRFTRVLKRSLDDFSEPRDPAEKVPA